MTNYEINTAKAIRSQYEERERTKVDELKSIDKRVKTPALVLAYVLGAVGALVLGVGMCLAMGVIGGLAFFGAATDMIVGITVGIIGMAVVSVNYPIYCSVLESRRARYRDEVMKLSDEILAEGK